VSKVTCLHAVICAVKPCGTDMTQSRSCRLLGTTKFSPFHVYNSAWMHVHSYTAPPARGTLHYSLATRKQPHNGDAATVDCHAVNSFQYRPQPPASEKPDEESRELPDEVIMAMLRREVMLTRAKLHGLCYDQIMGDRRLRSLKTKLRQVRAGSLFCRRSTQSLSYRACQGAPLQLRSLRAGSYWIM